MKKLLPIALLLFICFSGTRISAQDLIPSQWPHMTGYWKFQNQAKLTKATVGNDLTLVGTHQMVAGPSYYDTAIRINIGSYYKCRHGIAPNGGGDSVNEYSVMFDFKVLSLKKWHTFFQTDTNNKNDGECFIRPLNSATPGAIGVGSTGYSSKLITPNTWYRLVVSVKLGHFYRYYLNGDLIHEGDTQDIDGRFALNPYFLLFADENQEDDTIDIASVAVFDTCLTAAQVTKIGTIDPCVLYPISVSLGRDTMLCGAATLSKTAGTGNYTYKWSSGETTSSVVFSMAKHGTGSRNVWVKKIDINGCNRSDTFVLGIYTAPNVNLGRDTGFCQGLKIKLTAGSASNNSFEWRKLPSANIISKVNNYTIDSTGTYAVNMSNQFGCSDADTIKVDVYPAPSKPVINYSKKDICQGDSSILSGPAGFAKYAWDNGDTARSITTFGNLVVKLKVSSIHGCESPMSDSVRIILHSLPPKPELKIMQDSVLCGIDTAMLYVQNNYPSYIWNDGPGPSSRLITKAGSYNISVVDQFGCKSPASNTIKLTAVPSPAKPVIEVLGPTDLCEGDSVTLHAKDPAYKYIWLMNPSRSRDLTIKKPATLSLVVMDSFNCTSPPAETVGIRFHPIPFKPTIFQKGKDSLFCNFVSERYQWWVNDSLGDTTKIIKASSLSVYRVRIGSEWCWSEPSESVLFKNTGLTKHTADELMLKMHPNPAADIIHLQIVDLLGNDEIPIEISDASGKLLFTKLQTAEDLRSGFSIDLQDLPAGIYVVTVRTAGAVLTRRFVLQ